MSGRPLAILLLLVAVLIWWSTYVVTKSGYLGAVSSALSYLLYNRAIRDLDASQVGAFTNLAPVVGRSKRGRLPG